MDLINLFDQYVLPNYKRYPISFVKGQGVYLWDDQGEKYLDFFSGWAVSNLGHCHPKVTEAIKNQAEKLIHVPNIFYNPFQGLLAKKISENSFNSKVFFCNSGAEANEAAIKLARKRCMEKYEMVSLIKSFHGRTLGAMTVTGQSLYKKDFEPLPTGFFHCELNNIAQLEELINHKTAAVFMEPIQGEGGVNIVSYEFMKKARELCDYYDALLIFDEVQTGLGRTGKMFAYQHYGIEPDVMTLAKALGGGVAIGALVVKPYLDNILVPGTHASTFGGNPLATAAAVAVFDVMEEENILEAACEQGAYLESKLNSLKERYSFIQDVRGYGLMLGMVLSIDGHQIVNKCRENKLLINCTQGSILRLMPALNISKEEIDKAISILDEVLDAFI